MTPERLDASALDQSGLTLVEILFAIAVLGGALVGLLVVVPVSTHGIRDGAQLSTATFLAEQAIERARAATWTASPAIDCLGLSSGDSAPMLTGATCPGAAAGTLGDESAVNGYPQYGRTVRISSCALTPCGGVATAALRLVEITVIYTPLTGAGGVSSGAKTVQLAWLVAQK